MLSKTKIIHADSLSDAIQIAYNSTEFRFLRSKWFFDVKDIFRIFNYKGREYIVKEVNDKKGRLELANSEMAKDKLDGKIAGKTTIKVIVPSKVTLPDKESYFLVSEYLGADMNECVYLDKKIQMSLDECIQLLSLLLENGILYRGYLPRNIVETGGFLYLFDWEDAIFSDNGTGSKFDHLWQTNFLLNWSYFFGYNTLRKELRHCQETKGVIVEPDLITYERIFKVMTKDESEIYLLRRTIDKIVFGSELPLTLEPKEYYIRPNDMGHLVSDIFSNEIDVLYNILSFVFRQKDDGIFSSHILLMTKIISMYFNLSLKRNNSNDFLLKYLAIIPILMMLDDYLSEEDYDNILESNSIEDTLNKIALLSSKLSITVAFLLKVKCNLPKMVDQKLRVRIREAFPGIKTDNISNFENITKFILNLNSPYIGRLNI